MGGGAHTPWLVAPSPHVGSVLACPSLIPQPLIKNPHDDGAPRATRAIPPPRGPPLAKSLPHLRGQGHRFWGGGRGCPGGISPSASGAVTGRATKNILVSLWEDTPGLELPGQRCAQLPGRGNAETWPWGVGTWLGVCRAVPWPAGGRWGRLRTCSRRREQQRPGPVLHLPPLPAARLLRCPCPSWPAGPCLGRHTAPRARPQVPAGRGVGVAAAGTRAGPPARAQPQAGPPSSDTCRL